MCCLCINSYHPQLCITYSFNKYFITIKSETSLEFHAEEEENGYGCEVNKGGRKELGSVLKGKK